MTYYAFPFLLKKFKFENYTKCLVKITVLVWGNIHKIYILESILFLNFHMGGRKLCVWQANKEMRLTAVSLTSPLKLFKSSCLIFLPINPFESCLFNKRLSHFMREKYSQNQYRKIIF